MSVGQAAADDSDVERQRQLMIQTYKEWPLIKTSPYFDKMDTTVHRNFQTWCKVPPVFLVQALGTAEPISMHEALLKAAYCGKHRKVPAIETLHELFEHMTDIDMNEPLGDKRSLLEICVMTIRRNEENRHRLRSLTLPADWPGKDATWTNGVDEKGLPGRVSRRAPVKKCFREMFFDFLEQTRGA